MKILKTRLKQIIREELSKIVSEAAPQSEIKEAEQRKILAEDESMLVDMVAKSAELSPEDAKRLISAIGKMIADGVLGSVLVALGVGSLQKVLPGVKSFLDDEKDDE